MKTLSVKSTESETTRAFRNEWRNLHRQYRRALARGESAQKMERLARLSNLALRDLKTATHCDEIAHPAPLVSIKDREAFTRGFMIAAEWLATDSQGEERDARGLSWWKSSREKIEDICADFIRDASIFLIYAARHVTPHPDTGATPWGSLGADFFLTSAGYGVSFRDRDEIPETLRDVLCEKARGRCESMSATVYRGRVCFE